MMFLQTLHLHPNKHVFMDLFLHICPYNFKCAIVRRHEASFPSPRGQCCRDVPLAATWSPFPYLSGRYPTQPRVLPMRWGLSLVSGFLPQCGPSLRGDSVPLPLLASPRCASFRPLSPWMPPWQAPSWDVAAIPGPSIFVQPRDGEPESPLAETLPTCGFGFPWVEVRVFQVPWRQWRLRLPPPPPVLPARLSRCLRRSRRRLGQVRGMHVFLHSSCLVFRG